MTYYWHNIIIKIKKLNFGDEETGVPQSSLMALALEEYVDQKEVIKFTSAGGVQKIIDDLNKEVKNDWFILYV